MYLISYTSYKGSEVKNAEATHVTVFSTCICCLSLGQLLGSYIHLDWKRFASFCGGCGLILSIVGFLLIPTVWSLMFFMGITLGISSGFLFYCALFSYLALHQREKGLATGMGACFFVLQKIVWTLVANKTVNPEGLEVNNQGLFPDPVAEKVPQLLRIVVYTTMCLLLVGACMGSPWFRYIISDNQRSGSDAATECIGSPPVNGKQQRHDSKSSDDDGLELGEEDELEVDPKQIVTVNSEPEAPFPWMPLFVLFLGYICVTNMTFVVGNYKLLGFIIGADTPGMNDHNLSVIGAFNSVSAVIARPVWGLLTDKMNDRALLLNAALGTLLTVLFVESAKINIIFFGFVTVGVFFNAVSDPLWLPFCINYAGLIHGPKMYAFLSLPSRMSSSDFCTCLFCV